MNTFVRFAIIEIATVWLITPILSMLMGLGLKEMVAIGFFYTALIVLISFGAHLLMLTGGM